MTKVIGPSEESREVGETKKELAERYIIRPAFWKNLLARAAKKTDRHANISPGRYSCVGTSAGKRGLSFNCTVWQHTAGAELYIDRGKESGTENEDIFDQLAGSKEEIEGVFGESFDWQRLEGCVYAAPRSGSTWEDVGMNLSGPESECFDRHHDQSRKGFEPTSEGAKV